MQLKTPRSTKAIKERENSANNHIPSNHLENRSSKLNQNGFPVPLKNNIESLSGENFNDVKVHYNSKKPKQFAAHAYAQGTEIHLAAGQSKHLPHEAWHIVQQKQGRVRPNSEHNGSLINTDIGLEKEANLMGAKALQFKSKERTPLALPKSKPLLSPMQLMSIQISINIGKRQQDNDHFEDTKNNNLQEYNHKTDNKQNITNNHTNSTQQTVINNITNHRNEKGSHTDKQDKGAKDINEYELLIKKQAREDNYLPLYEAFKKLDSAKKEEILFGCGLNLSTPKKYEEIQNKLTTRNWKLQKKFDWSSFAKEIRQVNGVNFDPDTNENQKLNADEAPGTNTLQELEAASESGASVADNAGNAAAKMADNNPLNLLNGSVTKSLSSIAIGSGIASGGLTLIQQLLHITNNYEAFIEASTSNKLNVILDNLDTLKEAISTSESLVTQVHNAATSGNAASLAGSTFGPAIVLVGGIVKTLKEAKNFKDATKAIGALSHLKSSIDDKNFRHLVAVAATTQKTKRTNSAMGMAAGATAIAAGGALLAGAVATGGILLAGVAIIGGAAAAYTYFKQKRNAEKSGREIVGRFIKDPTLKNNDSALENQLMAMGYAKGEYKNVHEDYIARYAQQLHDSFHKTTDKEAPEIHRIIEALQLNVHKEKGKPTVTDIISKLKKG